MSDFQIKESFFCGMGGGGGGGGRGEWKNLPRDCAANYCEELSFIRRMCVDPFYARRWSRSNNSFIKIETKLGNNLFAPTDNLLCTLSLAYQLFDSVMFPVVTLAHCGVDNRSDF